MIEEFEISNYLFFNSIDIELIKKQYNPPYSLKIKLSYNHDNCFITIDTDKVLKIEELPQNIMDLINKYSLIKNIINCYSNELFLQFNIKLNDFEKNYVIKVDLLKKMILNK
jgi:hypothetical protein